MPMDTIRLGFVEKLEALAYKCRVAVERQEEREREKKKLQRLPRRSPGHTGARRTRPRTGPLSALARAGSRTR